MEWLGEDLLPVVLSCWLQVQSLPWRWYGDMLLVNLLYWNSELKGLVVQMRKKITLRIASEDVHGVLDIQSGCQNWLSSPNANFQIKVY